MKMNAYRDSLTGSTLKLIAIITMFIDHIGACVFERGLLRMETIRSDESLFSLLKTIDQILRLIGRISFPIFCFLLVEGFLHTRSKKQYAGRLLLFALISEIPFNLAIYGHFFVPEHQNVFFTLLIGLCVMSLCEYFEKKNSHTMQLLTFAGGLLLAWLLHTDYSYKGVFLIGLLYLFRWNRKNQILAGAIAFSWETTAPLAFLPIWFYNGTRGKSIKWFSYWFYPVHLMILWIITVCLLPVCF